MCGRTSCHLPRDALTRACAYRDRQGQQRLPEWRDPDKYCPSYNKSPQSSSPVLLSRLHFEKGSDSSERVIAPMRWGLVPSWFKEDHPSKLQFSTTNCRSDTMMEKRSFKVPLGKGRRCVILADGFYEWQRCQGISQKQPYFIYFPQIKTEKVSSSTQCIFGKSGSIGLIDSPENWEKVWDNWRLLTMAGIFDCWEPPEGGDLLYSYTIITVDSCKGLNGIHHRMPAILDGEEEVSKWLDFDEVSTQEALKLIHPTENIAFHPVSPVVNNSRNNTPECLAPVDLVVKKELKASGSSQKMLQWLATKSPKKENPKTTKKEESDVPQWSSQFLQNRPFPTKRNSAGLLERWLKREEEEEPVAKWPHSQ
ncbi:PREDICTED: embryonic stem cell-specific 5-hydroxymethylcytosine-binding protein isoform X1 [Galeopterus variegatus]|uniref:Abasic site processing protein HMCES n=1 Tax=Galeopterus variegatus TaxID=482537 RepID=A0ABM0Q532_GALVR|nr:PREDICTED: embryonic stem cell-specific 5-hydroxymethylcytosine-binding protein isoform X1 [Galeopterus variegatus]XP_008563473.1 PREDICTED: embryonic stem cell-specific 5-hydroxymethylcytosine-binding protein isoform X1 [Galeopterus variegatus]